MFKLATFNLENLDTGPGVQPPLKARIGILRPQLQRLDADIICLQEINAQKLNSKTPRVHQALDRLLEGTAYADFHRVSTMGPAGAGPADHHNLVILSRFPIERQEQVRHELVPAPMHRQIVEGNGSKDAEAIEWDRPALLATVRLESGELLHVLNLHLRAPLAVFIRDQKIPPFAWKTVGGWAEGFYLASVKRAGQALEARLVLERIFDGDQSALIAVCGDFNADEFEVPTRIILGREEDTGNGALAGRALIVAEHSVPPARRYTVVHHGRPQMLDHILISRGLSAWYRDTEIHNEDLGDELVAYQAIENPPESYHAPVIATFERPKT